MKLLLSSNQHRERAWLITDQIKQWSISLCRQDTTHLARTRGYDDIICLFPPCMTTWKVLLVIYSYPDGLYQIGVPNLGPNYFLCPMPLEMALTMARQIPHGWWVSSNPKRELSLVHRSCFFFFNCYYRVNLYVS